MIDFFISNKHIHPLMKQQPFTSSAPSTRPAVNDMGTLTWTLTQKQILINVDNSTFTTQHRHSRREIGREPSQGHKGSGTCPRPRRDHFCQSEFSNANRLKSQLRKYSASRSHCQSIRVRVYSSRRNEEKEEQEEQTTKSVHMKISTVEFWQCNNDNVLQIIWDK